MLQRISEKANRLGCFMRTCIMRTWPPKQARYNVSPADTNALSVSQLHNPLIGKVYHCHPAASRSVMVPTYAAVGSPTTVGPSSEAAFCRPVPEVSPGFLWWRAFVRQGLRQGQGVILCATHS